MRYGPKSVRLSKSDSRRPLVFKPVALGAAITLVLGLLTLPLVTIALPALDTTASANGVRLHTPNVLVQTRTLPAVVKDECPAVRGLRRLPACRTSRRE